MSLRTATAQAVLTTTMLAVGTPVHAAEKASLFGPALWVTFLLVLLGIVAWATYRRQKMQLSLGGEQFEVLAQQSLGPREKILLVKLANRRYVLGQTAHQITFIDLIESSSERAENEARQ